MTALGVQPIEKSGRPREGEKEASSTAPYAGERERERERGGSNRPSSACLCAEQGNERASERKKPDGAVYYVLGQRAT